MKAIVKDALNCIGNVQDFMLTQIQSAMLEKTKPDSYAYLIELERNLKGG